MRDTTFINLIMPNLHCVASALLITLAAGIVSSCGSSATSDDAAKTEALVNEFAGDNLVSAMKSEDMPRVTDIADSLALDVDELTNNETISVLLAYLTIHNEASANNNRELDLVTLRKYVDVYDLSMMRDRKGMTAAMKQARDINPAVDFEALYKQFRSRLSEYDALNGQELTAEPAPAKADADSVTAVAADNTPLN